MPPKYLGMDRHRFNAEVRPYVSEIPIGSQGVAFDRLELDAWADDYVSRNRRPGQTYGGKTWDKRGTPGLIKREGIWHIDKQVRGRRIRESCGTGDLREAETYLAHKLEEIRQAEIYGVRPTRTFREAAIKYVEEHEHKRSLRSDIGNLRNLLPWIGDVEISKVNMGTLQPWLNHRKSQKLAAATINHGLKMVPSDTELSFIRVDG